MSHSDRRRICVVTGSRADYGLLVWPMRAIMADPAMELQVLVTGMHLSPQFGMTVNQIRADGFPVSAEVESLIAGDSPRSIAKSVGLGIIGLADAFERLAPDMIMVLGDRYEILAAAQAALPLRIPVAHLCGGDTTEGAFDEQLRHAITKLSHLHLVTNSDAERRVIQMGEHPDRVCNVGSPGIDMIRHMDRISRDELFAAIGLEPRTLNVMVSFHPTTLSEKDALAEVDELLSALDSLPDDTSILLSGTNADTLGMTLNDRLREFSGEKSGRVFFQSLGSYRYLNALAHFDMLVGNSSSGLYEAPSFKIPTVNIGDRQKGRLSAASVINCQADCADILRAMELARALDCSGIVNPYGLGYSSELIRDALKTFKIGADALRKSFYSPLSTDQVAQ